MRFLLTLLFILTLAGVSFGQPSDQDKAAAVKRAKQFTKRLRRSQDIKPLLPEFFASDFLKRIEQDDGHNTLALLRLSDKQKFVLTEKQRQRYYFASMNWFYLTWLYSCWRDPKRPYDDVKFKDLRFPPGVRRILGRSPLLNLFMHSDEMEDKEDAEFEKRLPKAASDVEILTKNLEQINLLYRRSMRPLRLVSDRRFENIISKCEGGDFYRVEMASCNKAGDCPGVPKGVPLIGVSASPFDFIDFARFNGKMRIVRLFLWEESLK